MASFVKDGSRRLAVAAGAAGAAFLLAATCSPGRAAAEEPPAGVEYAIGVEDAVQLQVWQRPGLSGTYVVDDKGNLNLPLIGAVAAEGKTATQLGQDLERRFSVMDPGITQVLVTVTGFNSRRFTVVGEIRVPGVYTFREAPNLWDVILQAGGETPNADMSQVQIVRTGAGEGPNETLTVDLSAGYENTPMASLPALRPGDSVVIPALLKNAVAGDQVQVLGAVRTPGLYPVRVASTVVEALSVAGGQLDNAALDKVRLARRTETGTIVYTLDVRDYLKRGYPPADLALRAGDTVNVPSSSGGAGGIFRNVLSISGLLSAVAAIVIAANQL